jgi:hypothetical protein
MVHDRVRAGFNAGRIGTGLAGLTLGIALQGSWGALTFVLSGAGFMWG